MEKDEFFFKKKRNKLLLPSFLEGIANNGGECKTQDAKSSVITSPAYAAELPQPSRRGTCCRLPPGASFLLPDLWLHIAVCACSSSPRFLSFRRNAASGQTLIHPDSSAHLPALVWHPANSLIKVPGALLVQLVACKLINRLHVFNSLELVGNCSALPWALNQVF